MHSCSNNVLIEAVLNRAGPFSVLFYKHGAPLEPIRFLLKQFYAVRSQLFIETPGISPAQITGS